METELENEDYDTLGGFLYAQLDKIPVPGDTITFENLTFTVMDTRGRRITKVRVDLQRDQDATKSEPLLLRQPEGAKQEKQAQQTPPTNEPDSHYEYRGA